MANLYLEPLINLVKDDKDFLIDLSKFSKKELKRFDNVLSRYSTNNKLSLKQVLYGNGRIRGIVAKSQTQDAAQNISELLSASTDNAKELILAKINATSEFADI